MSINFTNQAENAIVISVSEDSRLKMRLAEMGILPGKLLRIVDTVDKSQMIVKIDESKIALGKTVSQLLQVIS